MNILMLSFCFFKKNSTDWTVELSPGVRGAAGRLRRHAGWRQQAAPMKQERGSNAVDSDSLSELERIKGYLGTFMERLSALSEEYETEKASLERAMFATLSDKSVAATQAIVDADFNKRMLVNVVKEYEQVGTDRLPRALSSSERLRASHRQGASGRPHALSTLPCLL